jgi:hypothetical protein
VAIEGPLRELGIHDVFQLLDLSRKTGTLAVTSALRDNEGTVHFQAGRVVAATIKSNPHRIGDQLMRSGRVTAAQVAEASALQSDPGNSRRLGEILLDMGAITHKELQRQVRIQIEAVVFELLSWREGFFRFEEGQMQGDPMVQIGIEALLMEGARRIDEWSMISDRVPSLLAIPALTALQQDTHAPMLDLLPSEWEVLTMIDGATDLRAISAKLARSEFDTAKVVYGLVSTGVVALKIPQATTESEAPPAAENAGDLERGYQFLRQGDFDGAVASWEAWLRAHPKDAMTEKIRAGLDAAARLRGLVEARFDG